MRCLALFLASVCTASAQVLPDPGNATVSISSYSPGSIQLPQASYARSMAERVMAGLSTVTNQISSNDAEIARLRKSIADAQARKARIEAERDRVLAEYKQGHFCSTCGKAKSEFPSEREFWAHIAEGAPQGRHAIPATPDQTAKKEAEFAAGLQAADQEIQASNDAMRMKELENKDGFDQLSEGMALWKTASELEQELLRANLAAAQEKDRQDLSEASRQLTQLDGRRRSAVGSGDKDTVQRIDDAIAMWRQVAQRVEDAAQFRYGGFQRDITVAAETANKEYAAIAGLVNQAYRNRVLPGLPVLPNMSLAVGSVTLFAGGSTIGAKFRFGRFVQGGIMTGAPDAVTAETRQFIDILGRLRISGGYQTRFTPDGVRQGTVFDIDLLPPKGEIKPKPAPDEKTGTPNKPAPLPLPLP